MAICPRWILIFTVLVALAPRVTIAAPSEKGLFNSAHSAFDDAFYDKAEKDFAAFALQFPNSPLVPQAILFQAESQVLQSNYAGAIALLSSRQSMAGTNADQYILWLAEAYSRKGDYHSAADTFARLMKTYPTSTYRLEAAVGEASARAALLEWPAVIALLQQPSGVFQSAARTNSGNDQVQRGYLALGEAQMMQKDFAGAETTLQPLGKLLLKPELAWRWQYLVCRLRLAEGRDEEALLLTTNLMSLATNVPTRDLEAQSITFRAGLLEGLGRTNEAIAAYTNNLADGIPGGAQRFALLRMTHLCLLEGRLEDASQTLRRFLERYPQAPAADLAWFTRGELQLRQCKLIDEPETGAPPESQAAPSTSPQPAPPKDQKENPPSAALAAAASAPQLTNCIQLARECFEALARQFPQSSLYGKGQLNLGWCLWYDRKMPESQKAFQTAVQHLPPSSIEQATAYFKLADTEYRQNDFNNALANYRNVIDNFASLEEAKTNLIERALYQAVRAALAVTNLTAVTNALGTILALYPHGFHTERAVLLAGQEFRSRGNPTDARKIFSDFIQDAPDAPLRSEVELAIARTYEHEQKWPEAIQQYDHWLATFTADPALPRAQYYRALAYAQANDPTNALIQFTNLVAQFPTNEFAAQAQLWVADYYFTTQNFAEAEKNYQLLSHNWPGLRLAYEAKMMAGKAAAAQLNWSDAGNYFTNLTSDPSCPSPLKLQARFAYGEALMSMPATDSVKQTENLTEAIRVFDTICQDFPLNRTAESGRADDELARQAAALAWGYKAMCYANSHQYELAIDAYQKVLDAPFASVAARSQALVGMADILEKQAEPKTGSAKAALLELALSHYLDVLYGKMLRDGEQADAFWVKEAGLDAFRLSEALQRWESAIKVCERLQDLLPNESGALQKRKVKALENLGHAQK